VFRNKIFFYSEVESLTQISPLTGFIQNRKAKIRIIEIKLKNKKTIHILIKAMASEEEKGLNMILRSI